MHLRQLSDSLRERRVKWMDFRSEVRFIYLFIYLFIIEGPRSFTKFYIQSHSLNILNIERGSVKRLMPLIFK